jgi:hypothetical protein
VHEAAFTGIVFPEMEGVIKESEKRRTVLNVENSILIF